MKSHLLQALFLQLQSSGLRYCLWKGRVDAEHLLMGDDDVDLLVAREDSQSLQKLLVALGFKLSQSGREKTFPGLIDYYGYDAELGTLIHIQLYHQLVCGERLVENLHLPIENALLESRVFDDHGIAFPQPAAELLVFILRKVFQNGDIFMRRRGAFKAFGNDVADELAFLLNFDHQQGVEIFAQQHLPMLDSQLVLRALELMHDASDSSSGVLSWLKVRNKIMSQLSDFQRRSFLAKKYEWVCRRLILISYRLRYKAKVARLPASGGRAIAIIGSDGTGKSTALAFIRQFLSVGFQTSAYHMGRPSPSLATRILSNLVRLATRLSSGRMRMPKPGQHQALFWPGYLLWLPMSLAVLIARDRYRTYKRIRRDVGMGKCVIIDRYPVKGIEWMDSPMIHRITGFEDKFKFLTAKERSYYERILPAEQTILLIVSPEIAAQRQILDGYDYVIERATRMHEAVPQLDESIEIIDTSCSLVEVQAQLAEKIWANI